MDDYIALRPRPVHIRVQDLGGKASRNTYCRYILQSTIHISTTTKYILILSRSHSGSTANGETGEEAESRSQRAQIYSNKYPGLYISSHYYKKESF